MGDKKKSRKQQTKSCTEFQVLQCTKKHQGNLTQTCRQKYTIYIITKLQYIRELQMRNRIKWGKSWVLPSVNWEDYSINTLDRIKCSNQITQKKAETNCYLTLTCFPFNNSTSWSQQVIYKSIEKNISHEL